MVNLPIYVEFSESWHGFQQRQYTMKDKTDLSHTVGGLSCMQPRPMPTIVAQSRFKHNRISINELAYYSMHWETAFSQALSDRQRILQR